MTNADRIRALAREGLRPCDIARIVKVPYSTAKSVTHRMRTGKSWRARQRERLASGLGPGNVAL